MPADPAILIRTGPDDDRDWRRFVAVLCFIEFYWLLVSAGADGWLELTTHHRVWRPFNTAYVVEQVIGVLRAFAFLCVGKALWLGPNVRPFWIAALGLTILADVAAQTVVSYLMFPHTNFTFTYLDSMKWAALEHAPWIAIAGAAWLLAHRQLKSSPRTAAWAMLGATWAFIQGIILLAGHIPRPVFYCAAASGLFYPFLHHLVVLQYTVLGLLTVLALLLLMRSRYSRTLALILVCIDIVPVVLDLVFTVNLREYRANQALIYSALSPAENPVPMPSFLLNRESFRIVFVNLVRIAAPWLLIAWYADRKPMFEFPDDGSPRPRRYCGKCYYNLHGADADRCPECGATLIAADRGSGRRLRHP